MWPKFPKAKKGAWFVKVRGSYLPASSQGVLLYVAYAAYIVFAVTVGYLQAATLEQAALMVIPNWVAAAAVMTYIAWRKS